VINLQSYIAKYPVILSLTTRRSVSFPCVGGIVVVEQVTTSLLITRFLFFQYESVAMDSTNNERSHHNQETRSEEDFTLFRSEELPQIHIFHESNKTTYNSEHNTITVETNKS
jgi:hypothetical protein